MKVEKSKLTVGHLLSHLSEYRAVKWMWGVSEHLMRNWVHIEVFDFWSPTLSANGMLWEKIRMMRLQEKCLRSRRFIFKYNSWNCCLEKQQLRNEDISYVTVLNVLFPCVVIREHVSNESLPDDPVQDGNTLLHIASQCGHPATALMLLRKGVPLHMPNKVLNTWEELD